MLRVARSHPPMVQSGAPIHPSVAPEGQLDGFDARLPA